MISITAISEIHLPDVQLYASDHQIAATSNLPSPYPQNGAEQWFSAVSERIAAGQSQVFAVVFKEYFCGIISLNAINDEAKSAELDYWIATPFQRRGIATQAASLAIGYATETLSSRKIFSTCLSSNEASARVLEHNGFIEIGRHQLKSGKFVGHEIRRFCFQMPNNSFKADASGSSVRRQEK
ncbi:GNAT family N-acetyltransferase [Rhodanobacter sp. MP1X3]|uniref:GNAT family N-acetyltransferase n=1 Tax=Rhodanobacter sp. MP1X3 TaxID=2723086 RepID=UPI00161C7FC8|nr:GNAT family N-acetyltransferase [Rhodanobacter sp. MP1X3]MBB6244267.1 RimJ/RimL family protein N-acetyltransferase [Rhodanobacter sp. MP1X3]